MSPEKLMRKKFNRCSPEKKERLIWRSKRSSYRFTLNPIFLEKTLDSDLVL